MLHIATSTTDPAFNLAFEERMLNSLPADHPGRFLLWQNAPAIIIGRHQCALEEIDGQKAKELGIPVLRRITGGGAVYHDAGNLNFSFIQHAAANKNPDAGVYLEPICATLASLGIEAKISGRNDIEVNGRKISGCAKLIRQNRMLLHGTLLINSDLDKLAQVLKPGPQKIQSKGVSSVRRRVMNISECRPGITIGEVREALIKACSSGPGSAPEEDMTRARKLAASKYRDPAWNLGASPPYNLEKREKFAFGEVSVRYFIREGRIDHCRVEGDFFGEVEKLAQKLKGLEFTRQKLKQALAGEAWDEHFYGCDPQAMLRFFLESAV